MNMKKSDYIFIFHYGTFDDANASNMKSIGQLR